jgi:DNA helicase-2/ATP-dependent DNA helicase PcrA
MLMLASRRADAKVATAMTGLFNAISGSGISAQDVIADANAHGGDFLKTWVQMAAGCVVGELNSKLVSAVQSRLVCAQDFLGFSDEVINLIGGASEVGANGALSEIGEDRAAWKGLARDIRTAVGSGISLDAFLQELEFRSKEAPAKVGEVALMTIHSSKGAEFDEVYLLGLAEEVLPSYQSVQKGETSPEMEEERRNCFVAITRTRRRLTLSRAKRYRGWKKAPSRFLAEMELI